PPVPATRPAPREGRPGAPLWRLVRFDDAVAGAEAAGIEAALHAAGLLDAWVHPEANATQAALAGGEQDGYLAPLPAGRRPTGRTLSNVLVPEEQDDVPAARIAAVLASIAFADVTTLDTVAPTTVGPHGRYAHGVAVGGYGKVAPE